MLSIHSKYRSEGKVKCMTICLAYAEHIHSEVFSTVRRYKIFSKYAQDMLSIYMCGAIFQYVHVIKKCRTRPEVLHTPRSSKAWTNLHPRNFFLHRPSWYPVTPHHLIEAKNQKRQQRCSRSRVPELNGVVLRCQRDQLAIRRERRGPDLKHTPKALERLQRCSRGQVPEPDGARGYEMDQITCVTSKKLSTK